MLIRDALAAEMPQVGQLRVTAYRAGGHMSEHSDYAPHLRDLGVDGFGDVLVAVTPRPGSAESDGAVAGTVMLQLWPHAGHVVTGPGEAEVRALAVAPDAQGAGVGTALIQAVIERARANGVSLLLLFTQSDMHTAQRLYERSGFRRLPDKDWSPSPEVMLLAYGLPLARNV